MAEPRTKMKIAFVVWTLAGMGGSEKVVYDIVRKLDKDAFEIIIIGFSDGPVRELYDAIGVKVFSVSKSKGLDLAFLKTLRKIFVAEHIDAINVHHYGPFLYSSLASVGLDIKLIYTEHSRWQLEELSPLHKALNWFLLQKADAVIAISRQIQDYYLFQLKLQKEKVYLIPNGIDHTLFKPRDSLRLRKQMGIGEDEKVVGIVANLRPEKNHRLLISAFSNIVGILPKVRLIIVGDDCMDGQVQKFALESRVSDRINFLGHRDDIPDLLGLFDVFCLPSIHEGMPLTVLEAMSMGVPVVGADVLGINEVVVDGSNGLLFDSGSIDSLVKKLTLVLTDIELCNKLSSAGRDFVFQNYALDDKVNQYQKLFASLCSATTYLSERKS